jgi:flagellar motor switch/type III secretory pathway protein FliN
MSTAAFTPEPKAVETTVSARVQNNDDLLDSMAWLSCQATVELPVVRFTIGDLLALTPGSIVETACNQTSDVPLRVNRLLIGWTEFEVVGDRLAVRITDQA